MYQDAKQPSETLPPSETLGTILSNTFMHFSNQGVKDMYYYEKPERKTVLIRLFTNGGQNAIETEFGTEYIMNLGSKMFTVTVDGWLKANGVFVGNMSNQQVSIKLAPLLAKEPEQEAKETLEEKKPKRIRMGKWGVKREHIKGE